MTNPPRHARLALCTPGPLQLYSTMELLELPPPTWLIEGIIPAGGLIGLYGAPGSCKSFVAVDWAMSVAYGVPWQGRASSFGFVLYISAEGGTGIGKRAKAWLHTRNLLDMPNTMNMGWLTQAISIYGDSNDLDTLLLRIERELDQYPTLVVIDTLARCLDGDENLQLDMGRFVKGADRLRTELGATVLVVHHTRKDGETERGSTAFRGAADAMLEVKKEGKEGEQPTITVSCNKQKDAEEFESIRLLLKPIPETASCVLVGEASGRELEILEALRLDGPCSAKTLSLRCANIPGRTLFRALRGMREKGEIIRESGIYAISSATSK